MISAASLLFAPGERPRAEAIVRLAKDYPGLAVSMDPALEAGGERTSGPPPEAASGEEHPEGVRWLEMLANGLTFDIAGLAPGAPTAHSRPVHRFGLPVDLDELPLERLSLRPGPHLAGGTTMLPVVRSLAWIAAILSVLPGVRAVAWHPARSWCAPTLFRESVFRWVEGGVFPAFSLAALTPTSDGGMQSEGLALFTGQELRLEPELARDRAAGGRLGLRLLNLLFDKGRILAPDRLSGPDGQPLRIEPSPNGRFVRVWRG